MVYEQLRATAGSFFRAERAEHTLQPTALIHEAYLKLAEQDRMQWHNQTHFLAVAAQAIRRILVDHARGRHREKRGGGRLRLSLDEELISSYDRSVDLIALDDAMAELSGKNPQQAKIVEMRFFAGLTIQEASDVLQVSTSSVERDWRYARAWLFRELGDQADASP